MMASPLSGDWPIEARAALLDELLHQLDWRQGDVPFDAAAFSSAARVAFLSGSAHQLIREGALPVSASTLAECKRELDKAGRAGSTSEDAIDNAAEELTKIVDDLTGELRTQRSDPQEVVEGAIRDIKAAHDKVIDAKDALDTARRHLHDLGEALEQ